ncbi:MAG: amidohydrolase [Alphaproteobacteria bacterium]|nr:amidohydrolase [Alphaproteobacteria bacterium]
MIIDIHAHYAPQAMFDALASQIGDFPSVEMKQEDGQYQLAFAGGAMTRPVMPKLRDSEQRLQWLTERGIDHQVCGGWLDMFGYELPAGEATAWSRMINEYLLEATAGEPRLTGLASVPMQDGKRAAEVLNEAMDAGFPGVMIAAQPKGEGGNLDDPGLDPFWETASDRAAVVMIHPVFDTRDPRLTEPDLVNAVVRLNDMTAACARLLFSGHFVKYNGMKAVLSTGGGALPFAIGRLARNFDANPGKYADPEEGLAQCYFDSIVFQPDALRYLCGKVGAERVMLGSDYPFPIGDPEPTRVVHDAPIAETDKQKILSDTAARLFGIA